MRFIRRQRGGEVAPFIGGVKVEPVIRLLCVTLGCSAVLGASDRLPGYQLVPQAPTLGPHNQNWE